MLVKQFWKTFFKNKHNNNNNNDIKNKDRNKKKPTQINVKAKCNHHKPNIICCDVTLRLSYLYSFDL